LEFVYEESELFVVAEDVDDEELLLEPLPAGLSMLAMMEPKRSTGLLAAPFATETRFPPAVPAMMILCEGKLMVL